jgi:hypothetical protein
MALSRHNKRLLIFFFLFLAAIRASFLGSGALTFLDEDRYRSSFYFINALFNLDFKAASLNLTGIDGRPADTVFRTIPALIQGVIANFFHIAPMGRAALLVPTIINLLFSLGNSYLLFLIGLNIFKNDFLKAFVATVFYSLLVNTNFYFRHISAHDHALFFFLLSLYFLIQKSKVSPRLSFVTGLAAGGIFTLYPGYYFSALMLGLLVFHRTALKTFVYFLGGLTVLPIFFQVLTFASGRSYFQELLLTREAQQVDQEGTFHEGFTFLFKYLLDVEGLPGILLGVGSVLFVIRLFKTRARFDSLQCVGLGLVLSYLIHGSIGMLFQKWVYYGRLLHLYFPIMVLMTVQSLSLFKKREHYVFKAILICSFVQFAIFSKSFRQIQYPQDIAQRMQLRSQVTFLSDFKTCEYNSYLRSLHFDDPSKTGTVFVNFCRIKPTHKTHLETKNLELVLSTDHFLAFKPYQYEGYSIAERNQFKNENLKMYIYNVRGAGLKPKT